MAYDYNQQEQPKSKYNEAVSQIIRIGNLWNSCHFFRKRGNLTQWNTNLDCIWMELCADAEPNDEKEINNFNAKLLRWQNRKDFSYQILMQKEKFLRKLQQAQGKGTAYEDPEADDM